MDEENSYILSVSRDMSQLHHICSKLTEGLNKLSEYVYFLKLLQFIINLWNMSI